MSLTKFLICVTISCECCFDYWSNASMRGSSKFIREHMESCGISSFNIQHSYEYEVIE